MTVGELKKALEGHPEHMDVFIKQTNTKFKFSLSESAQVENIPFKEDPNWKPLAESKEFVISDEN